MFSFFHRTPTITLDAFTAMPTVHQLTPIVKASQAFPDWFKRLPGPGLGNANQSSAETTNMRRCFGFTELFKKSFVMENWTDVHFEFEKDTWKALSKAGDPPTFHHQHQHNFSFSKYHLIKLHSPWFLNEKTGLRFTWMGASWHHEDCEFEIMPGVEEYQIQHSTNTFIKFPKKSKKYKTLLPIGLPLVHIIPMTDKHVDIKCHLISESEIKKYQLDHLAIAGHRGLLSLLKRNQTREQQSCPFSNK